VLVRHAMRYGRPSIASTLDALKQEGVRRILVLPLYPQYAAATTATVGDKVFRALMRMRYQPAVRIARPYYDDPGYIDALARSVTNTLSTLTEQPEVIVASYHGLPQKYADKGDPYPLHCAETTRLLRDKLGLSEERLIMTFQSRFGPSKWLQPYTDKTIAALARKKVKRIAVITPAFSADCLETLEEIAIENADVFRRYGGEQFTVVPCLNDTTDGMAVINAMVRRELQGWI
jgi:ferrochelatase